MLNLRALKRHNVGSAWSRSTLFKGQSAIPRSLSWTEPATAKALLCSTGIGLTANIPVSEAMARRNQSKAAVGRCKSKADRSSYFARREAAKVLRIVLQGDAARNAKASIKSLVYSPSVRNKKATFALLCQTLKCMHQSILISSNTSHAFRFF